MQDRPDIPDPERPGRRPVRLPSARRAMLLAAAMLAVGFAAGAAIGPAPDASLAGSLPGLAERLPALIAGVESRSRTATAGTAAGTATATASSEQAPPAKRARRRRKAAGASAAGEASSGSGSEAAGEEAAKSPKAGTKKLPDIGEVWLIELSGESFEAALAQPSAAPYIDTELLPAATLLKGWSAMDASAFASDAALLSPPAAGASPPLLRSIVQPPCPEGAAGAACAPETPGQLTAADEFLKATLATITSTSAYREHGLIVITFASVGIATQSELPAGASTATLAYQPPAGAVLLSPFAKAGSRSTAAFDPTSPRQSAQALLH